MPYSIRQRLTRSTLRPPRSRSSAGPCIQVTQLGRLRLAQPSCVVYNLGESSFPIRLTQAAIAVLRVFAQEPTKELYGLEICDATGLPSGTVHPILARLEVAGILESQWEEIDPAVEGRPRRRYYSL